METTLDDISVLFVRAEGGPAGARKAFDALEGKLPTLKGRKFYGAVQDGEYRACVALAPGDDPAAWGFETGVLPGGRYARAKLADWRSQVHEIARTFRALAEGRDVDPTRPAIEFYRSSRELVCLLPIRGGSC